MHDHSFENFLFSGVEAFASGALRGYDDGLAECALKAAREDFAFAQKKFALTGVDLGGASLKLGEVSRGGKLLRRELCRRAI